MEMNLGSVNWLAILLCVVVGQVFLTVWFAAIFAEPWAKAYGAVDKKQHTAEIPAYTYAIGAVCVALLSVGLAILQAGLGVHGVAGGALVGVFVALSFCIPTALPGYAFLKRWSAFFLAIGSQSLLIVILSIILAAWPA